MRFAFLITAGVLIATGCSSGEDGAVESRPVDASDTTDGTQAPAYEPSIEARDCTTDELTDVPETVTVECSWLVVPIDRAEPDGGQLRLAVRVLPSTSSEPAADPMVFLSGGPGQPGGEASFWAAQPFVAERDVVLWDQRGTGASEPDMDCPEADEVYRSFFTSDAGLDQDRANRDAAFAACRDRLLDEGVDLEAFTTPVSAEDLADLRMALGFDEWNIYGLSYGTRLAMETMRSHPGGLRSVVLDSVYPMDASTVTSARDSAAHAFQQLSDGCAADPACAAQHDDLRADIATVVEMYDAEPYRSTIQVDGEPVDLVLTGQDIQAGIYDAIYGHSLIPSVPGVVSSLLAGEAAILDAVAAQSIPAQGAGAEAMAHLVDCADASAVESQADAELLSEPGDWGATLLFVTWSACDVWPSGEVDDSFGDAVESDIPTLVLAGTYDPATAFPGAEQVANGFSEVTFVPFEGHGHGLWNDSECAIDIANAFISDPTAAVDTSCADALGPPEFG